MKKNGAKKMQINNLLQSAEVTTPQASTTTGKLQTFSDDDKDAIAYFFMRLQNTYGTAKMQSQWPDSESLSLARREFGKQIAKFSREEMAEAFDLAHKEIRAGNVRFSWPDIDAIIGLLTNEGVFTGSAGTLAHKPYVTELENCTREDRKRWAKKGIAELRALFDG